MALTSSPRSIRSVADELTPVLHQLLGPDLPIAFQAWDGSRAGPADADVTIQLHSPSALQHLMWAPNELGLARAHISGGLDIDGDIFDLLSVRDVLAAQGDVSMRLGPSGSVALARSPAAHEPSGGGRRCPTRRSGPGPPAHAPARRRRHRAPLRRVERLLPAAPRTQPHLLVRVLVRRRDRLWPRPRPRSTS